MSAAIHWSGPVLVAGAVALGLAIVLIASRPVVGQATAGQIGSALFGAMLAIGFAWIGVALWTADG